jgi:hypothetical protein
MYRYSGFGPEPETTAKLNRLKNYVTESKHDFPEEVNMKSTMGLTSFRGKNVGSEYGIFTSDADA